jgi:hypothetical protein
LYAIELHRTNRALEESVDRLVTEVAALRGEASEQNN